MSVSDRHAYDLNLDSLAETTVFIPYAGPDDDEDDTMRDESQDSEGNDDDDEEENLNWPTFKMPMPTPSNLEALDVPNGPKMRLQAFREVWTKCLQHMQDIIHELNEPIVDNVITAVEDAYKPRQPLLLLPRVELPVIVISSVDRLATLNVFDEVRQELLDRSVEVADSSPSSEGDGQSKEDFNHDAMSVDGRDDNPNPATKKRQKLKKQNQRSAPKRHAYVTSLSPTDCPNVISAMRTLISGFIEHPPDPNDPSSAQVKRKVNESLAPHDINLLVLWYNAVVEAQEAESTGKEKADVNEGRKGPKLVLLLQNFEQFEPSVMQDVFYICSQYIPTLPLVFIIALSSPPQLSYLHATYTRATLALLQIQRFDMKGGKSLLETLIRRTFFDLTFEPDVMLDPATLLLIVEQFEKYNTSIDFVFSLLQLVHMRHFLHPCTILLHEDMMITNGVDESEILQEQWNQPAYEPLRNYLFSSLPSSSSSATQNQTLVLLNQLASAQQSLKAHARNTRLGFALFKLVHRFLFKAGYAKAQSPRMNLDLMAAALSGRIAKKEGSYLVSMVRELPLDKLDALLTSLHAFFRGQPTRVRRETDDSREKIVMLMSRLPQSGGATAVGIPMKASPKKNSTEAAVANDLADWMLGFFETNIVNYRAEPLSELWYISSSPALIELVNPSPHVSVVTALLHPERYLDIAEDLKAMIKRNEEEGASTDMSPSKITSKKGKGRSKSKGKERETAGTQPSMQFLPPDTSLLYQRYLDSGRMINVYDWYESFALSLEQREAQQRQQKQRSREPRKAARESKVDIAAPAGRSLRTRLKNGNERKDSVDRKKQQLAVMVENENEEESEIEGERNGMEIESEADEEEVQRRKREIQARFIRSLHELDYLGFVKHTGRKVDHVVKTSFDLLD